MAALTAASAGNQETQMPIKPTHVFRTDPKTKRRVLAESHPLVRIKVEGKGIVMIQDGKFMQANGEPMDALPPWAEEQMDMMPTEALREVGIQRNAPPPAEEPEAPKDESQNPEVNGAESPPAESTESTEDEAPAIPQPQSTGTKRGRKSASA